MEDIKSFLQSRLKNIRDTDMSTLIDICEISRAKFYKCLKEPWCFSDSDLTRIADKMNLSETERETLFAFKNDSDKRLSPDKMSTDARNEELYELAHKIIFRAKATPTDGTNRIFTLFRDGDITKGNTTYCSDDLSEMLWKKINAAQFDSAPSAPPSPLIDILVFNSLADHHRAYIFTLIRSLYEKCPITTVEINDLISTTHYIHQTEDNSDKYMQFYSDWCALIRYGYYTMHFTDKLSSTFLEHWNGCLISYTDHEGYPQNLLVSINAQNNISIYSFANQNLYRFLKYNAPSLQREGDFKQLLSNNFMEISPLLIDLAENHPKITIDANPCLTTITAELFSQVETWITNPENKWTGINKLKSAVGSSELTKVLGDAQLINVVFRELKRRFKTEEENGVINLISATGLRKFVQNRELPDMQLVGIKLTKDQVIEQLKYYKANLGSSSKTNHQHYYIVPNLDIAVIIHKGRCAMMAPCSESVPLLYFKSVTDKESSIILHDYVMNRLLREEFRDRHSSPVMSDDMARNFIDSLIFEVQNSDISKDSQDMTANI